MSDPSTRTLGTLLCAGWLGDRGEKLFVRRHNRSPFHNSKTAVHSLLETRSAQVLASSFFSFLIAIFNACLRVLKTKGKERGMFALC